MEGNGTKTSLLGIAQVQIGLKQLYLHMFAIIKFNFLTSSQDETALIN